MLFLVVFVTFVVVIIAAVLLEVLFAYTGTRTNTNPQFLKFQRIYFLVYYPLLFGDWLNAPYLYKLYSSYGFLEEQIAIIYVCGFASALFLGAGASPIVKKYGYMKTFIAGTLTYALACLMKLSSDYSTLIVSRILSGSATSLLFTAQEMWYIDKHIKYYDFPPEWVPDTFTKSSKGNGFLAISAGVIAYLMSEVYGFGPVAPSVLSVFVLLLSCIIASSYWSESSLERKLESKLVVTSNVVTNKPSVSGEKKKMLKECLQGLRTIAQSSDLMQVGCIQALFESVLCMFVFLWTPVLDHHNPPLGIVFASLMAATLVGGGIYRIIASLFRKATPAYCLFILLIAAAGSVISCVLSTEPTREFPIISFAAFFMFETISGIYFPVMADLKHEIELDKLDFALTTWFRVPLNLFSCVGLLFLHSSSNTKGTRYLFLCCVVLIIVSVALSFKFIKSAKRQKPLIGDTS